MTITTTKNQSISRFFFQEKKRFDWITKVYRNCQKLLRPISNLVQIDTVTFKKKSAANGTLVLEYSGQVNDLKKIESVFETTFVNGQAVIKFSRLTVTVKLRKKQQAAKIAA